MFVQESEWIRDVLESHVGIVESALDIGSGDKRYLQKPAIKFLRDYLMGSGANISTLDVDPGAEPMFICDIAEDMHPDLQLPGSRIVIMY